MLGCLSRMTTLRIILDGRQHSMVAVRQSHRRWLQRRGQHRTKEAQEASATLPESSFLARGFARGLLPADHERGFNMCEMPSANVYGFVFGSPFDPSRKTAGLEPPWYFKAQS